MGRPKKVVTEAAVETVAQMTKTDFVKSVAADMPAKEVSELAKVKGIEISPNYVNTIRSNLKAKAVAKKAAKAAAQVAEGKAAPVPATPVVNGVKTGGNQEALFRSIVIKMGTEQARKILESLESGS
jgi:hypothetical protein